MDSSRWERLLEVERLIQRYFPEAAVRLRQCMLIIASPRMWTPF